MALDVDIVGGTSGVKADTDANKNLFVNLPTAKAQGGFAALASELDSGSVTGTRNVRAMTGSIYNRLSTGRDTVRFSHYANATTQNTAVWTNTNTTFAIQFGVNGYDTFNSGAITTSGAAQVLQTRQCFPLWGSTPLMFEFSEFRSVVPPANTQFEAGFFLNAGTPFTPTDGVYFRFNSTGLNGVFNFNGTEFSTLLVAAASLVLNDNTTYRIVVNHYRVEFWGATAASAPRVLLAEIAVPAANGPPFSAISAPAGYRYLHSGVAGAAVSPKIGNTFVVEMDTDQGMAARDVANGMGLLPQQGQNGGPMGTTALYSNSLAAGAGAAMTNTTAALGSGFGGQFSFQPTLAAGTDGILCSYQNPATAVNQTGRTIFITGVRVQGAVTTVLAGNATPVILAYSLAFGHTNVSLATAEASNAKAARRIALGFESYAAAAALGTLGSANGIYVPFNSPVPVQPGEFVAVCAKNLGVVTTTGVITALVTFDGYMQ